MSEATPMLDVLGCPWITSLTNRVRQKSQMENDPWSVSSILPQREHFSASIALCDWQDYRSSSLLLAFS